MHFTFNPSRWRSIENDLAHYRRKTEFIANALGGREHFLPITIGESTKITIFDGGYDDEAAVAKENDDKKILGPMKGRYRKVLVDFYTGKMQVPKSLQTGILLGVNALWAQDFPVEDRVEFLLERLQGIEVTNPDFSSRLWNEEWDAIRYDIEHVVDSVEKLRSEPTKNNIEKSSDILSRWAAAMKQAGFVFGDPTTWDRCWEGNSPAAQGNSFSADNLTEEELDIITTEIAPVFVCPVDVAAEAVAKMVRLAHLKDRSGDGMSQKYRRAVLTDEGIHCQENSKLAACWNIVRDAGFIYMKCGPVFNKDRAGDGRASMYALGPRIRDRFVPSTVFDEVGLPEWLDQVLHQDVLSPLHTPDFGDEAVTKPEPVVNLDWSRWNTKWLSRVSSFNQTYPLIHT